MLVVMRPDASAADIDYVVRRAGSLGLKAHLTRQHDQTVIGLMGDVRGLPVDALAGLHGVDRVQPVTHPFRLASRDARPGPTVVAVRDRMVGGEAIAVIAGPCSVETRERLLDVAVRLKAAGATMLRGGAYKPRTSPYSFQGIGESGLELLVEARDLTGLPIVTEVIAPEHVPLVCRHTDVLQIGQRNMQNFALLNAVGESGMPVLLKRGMMSTIEELLLSAEYVLAHGNEQVMLCERGIRTFETYTRNTLDINAVPLLKQLTHLPIIVDPSHATGKAGLVRAVSRAAVAAGADGLIVEVHPDPDHAWSDGFQSITPEEFGGLLDDVRRVAAAVGRRA